MATPVSEQLVAEMAEADEPQAVLAAAPSRST
jgi:hypothetical protein